MKHTPAETTEAAAAAILHALSGMVQCHSPEETAEALVSLIRDNDASHNDKARFVMSLLIVASEAASAFAVDAVEGSAVADQRGDEDDENALIKAGIILRDVSRTSNHLANELCNHSDSIPHTVR
ncbi:hypothetical protein UFOVP291_2 [uncultured Caudovirales phage]|uniref:Uncharacterized protein n=1 Tax=uncultured Caudovirales phage TaxID=2100421 RepID=A0A6J5LQ70_9CAUD|nr:hypothetical protein UFOVP291_2 [uncultured Caudovirales phage]